MKRLLTFLCLLSLPALSENINISNPFAPAGCSAPPGGFGLTFVPSNSNGWAGFTYSSMVPVPPNVPIANASFQHTVQRGSDGSCVGPLFNGPGNFFLATGGSHTFISPVLPFGTGGGTKYVGVKAWVHGGSTMTVSMTTSARTVTVASTQWRYVGATEPFIIANDKKFIYGYTSWPWNCSGTEGIYYKVVPLNPGETVTSFSGRSAVFDNAACGGGVMGMQGDFKIDSGLRVEDNGTAIPIAAEPPPILTSPLRIRKNGNNLGIRLVAPTDPKASAIRVPTSSGVMSLEKFVP
jgi:hypothetical protein